MEKLTVKETINLLKEEIEKLKQKWFEDENPDHEDIFREMIGMKKEKPEWNYYESVEAAKEFNLFRTVELEEGMEGGGEHCHAVLKFNNGQYFRVNWNYYSYHGEDCETILEHYNWEEVKPVEVLRTEYHTV